MKQKQLNMCVHEMCLYGGELEVYRHSYKNIIVGRNKHLKKAGWVKIN